MYAEDDIELSTLTPDTSYVNERANSQKKDHGQLKIAL